MHTSIQNHPFCQFKKQRLQHPARIWTLLLVSILLSYAAAGQVVATAAPTSAGILPALEQFRAVLGGGPAPGPNGSFGGLRREINWDGVPDALAAPNFLPPNFFNVNSPRGVVFQTPGVGFQVSATAGAGPIEFSNINPSYPSLFAPFSPQRLFTAIGSNVTDIYFYVPGTNTPALTRGFGAIFSDVDIPGATRIEYFGQGGVSLASFEVPAIPGNETFSFFGFSFATPMISRVRIIAGNTPIGANEVPGSDVVVMDDFIYGEPVPLVPPKADLSVTKTASSSVAPGETITYNITITNNGPDAAQNVTLSDALPAGTSFQSITAPADWSVTTPAVGSGGTVTATRSSFAKDVTASFTIVTTLSAGATGGATIINTASVSSTTMDPTTGNNTAQATTTVSCPSITVAIPDAMALPSGVLPNTVYTGYGPAASITLTADASGGTGPYTFNWSTGSNDPSITVSPTETTTYSVSVTDANGCPSNTASITIQVTDVRSGKNADKVLICHKPGKLNHTLSVGVDGVADHLAHGDLLGTCAPAAATTKRSYVEGEKRLFVPEKVNLRSYPNPFVKTTHIQYALPVAAKVNIKIVDLLGREVGTVFNGAQTAGTYRIEYNSASLNRGVYYCQMIITANGEEYRQMQKILKTE